MLTSAYVLANANAVAAGQGKKAAQVQLQAEINNDEEWRKFVMRDGLLVVDVYTEWCGPCIGMLGNLKKIKVELGGDNLHLAVAKSDTIEVLKRFRNRSEPTWMFIAAGQLITVIFGADAPRIARTIEQELKNEELAKKGERERPNRAPHELTPQEQEVADAQAKLLQERQEKEAAAAEADRLGRREARAKRLETHFADICPALMSPHAQKNLRKVADALEPYGVLIADKCPIVLTRENLRVVSAEDPAFGGDAVAAAFADRPALALLLKKPPEREGDVIELSRRALCGDGVEVVEDEAPTKSVADELRVEPVPGLLVPADRYQRAALLDLLFPKMVSSVLEPPSTPEPPHVALVFGAWQRRAVLAAAAAPALRGRMLRYGFFADGNVAAPRLLCKRIDQYELRPEKDYCETLILMVSTGVAEPLLADPSEPVPAGPPRELTALGPVHISADNVLGREECIRLFPPGYTEPEHKPKQKHKKKKKKRTKEEAVEDSSEGAPAQAEASCEADAQADADADAEADAEAEGDGEAEGEEDAEVGEAVGDDAGAMVEKATSPPPPLPPSTAIQ